MSTRYALVTGSNRGIGLEFTRQLLARGYHVFATCRHPDAADALHALRSRYPDRLRLLALDVADPTSAESAFQAVADQTDRLHRLINNAGIDGGGRADRFGDLDPDRMARVFRVNAIGPAHIAQRATPLLATAAGDDERAIVANISSGLGSIENTSGSSTWQSYRASKAALNMLTRVMAFDLVEQGVLAVALTPGWVQTDMGGAHAAITPEASVTGMLHVIENLPPDESGTLLSWEGKPVPW
jgi:NAD(P)-dependent dehydrogenase (short-subunit alcohol dehydrogenase family)